MERPTGTATPRNAVIPLAPNLRDLFITSASHVPPQHRAAETHSPKAATYSSGGTAQQGVHRITATVPGERRLLRYGGDVSVARSIANVHRENPWTGRCLGCNQPSPCLERRYANAVLIYSGRETQHPRLTAALTLVVGIGLGMLVIAAGLFGFL